MSSIDKLSIQGIRSFDSHSRAIVQFYTPLTLIVGHNGAGKTTIIEALKYATTGDLPPNSRNGAFIFDPKLAGESEVLAQVKLKFHNVNGRQMVVTRSIQLTKQRTKVSQKTLESLLHAKDPETGEHVSISSRCADLDQALPLQLGVSKAVLDNVIFCHQEESNWPLSEPSILKKKFDEIFAATRYTKALDNIKTLRKEATVEMRLNDQQREFLRVNRRKARKTLRSQEHEHEEDLAERRRELDDLKSQKSRVAGQIHQLQEQSQGVARTMKGLEADLLQLPDRAKEVKSWIDRLQGLLTTSVDLENGRDRLEQIEKQVQSLHQEAEKAETRMAQEAEEIASLEREEMGSRERERNIRDTLRWRDLRKQLQGARDHYGEMVKAMGTTDRSGCQKEMEELQARQQDLMTQRAGLLGEMKQLEDQVARLTRDLEGEYRDVDGKYRRHLIKSRVRQSAAADLDKYALALEKSIMKYHSLKMEEINKVIRELWVNTYQGSDIDTIEIRSESDKPKTGGSSLTRSYNYRVVMIRGETELDLRGRCSAGQRVLTSLIVRLALAESFCVQCGVLALDEPTTNLDRDNIASLAGSLVQIIQHRRQQRNFQLIIITHDEEFMRLLGRSDYADYYWRVSKNSR
ncbi:P-loop containing nucleoside triphosphate hydrolase protein [Piptocephalis cylindrospora]|uniref:DNA repair protein RAD50 n=1 Tax=Piptocephalis cylindrospora TaxID=1907219 RepID=A0A4P9Y9D0_9FUNG|nr:P-loop containing nucleoside triphosphate hydrolase protein [Piptocephalis cylindrospora]|eukprot:RKP14620.1 P-loop containing nucleoside triphosphate hydrolase protein [Piptocephalis cylindrospora]